MPELRCSRAGVKKVRLFALTIDSDLIYKPEKVRRGKETILISTRQNAKK
jgi:hypothetical protein